jgi:hypothetical protein
MRMSVEGRPKIRVAEQSLRGLDGLSHLREYRRMSVPAIYHAE